MQLIRDRYAKIMSINKLTNSGKYFLLSREKILFKLLQFACLLFVLALRLDTGREQHNVGFSANVNAE